MTTPKTSPATISLGDLVEAVEEKNQELRTRQRRIESQARAMQALEAAVETTRVQLMALTARLEPLAHYEQLERIGQFVDVRREELQGFRQFEKRLARYPEAAQPELRRWYTMAWERAYWHGFIAGRARHDAP